MRRAAVVALAISAVLCSSALATAQSSPAEAQLRQAVEQWASSQKSRKFSTLENLLSAKFVGTAPSGKIRTKAELIARHRGDKNTYGLTKNDSVAVQLISPSVGIVTGKYVEKGHDPKGTAFQRDYRFTDVFRLEGNVWRVVGSHTQLVREL